MKRPNWGETRGGVPHRSRRIALLDLCGMRIAWKGSGSFSGRSARSSWQILAVACQWCASLKASMCRSVIDALDPRPKACVQVAQILDPTRIKLAQELIAKGAMPPLELRLALRAVRTTISNGTGPRHEFRPSDSPVSEWSAQEKPTGSATGGKTKRSLDFCLIACTCNQAANPRSHGEPKLNRKPGPCMSSRAKQE